MTVIGTTIWDVVKSIIAVYVYALAGAVLTHHRVLTEDGTKSLGAISVCNVS